MEQAKGISTTVEQISSKVQQLAALSKRLDFTKKKGVNWGIPMPSEAKNGENWVYGYCMGCMQADCSTKNWLKDGILVNCCSRMVICSKSIGSAISSFSRPL